MSSWGENEQIIICGDARDIDKIWKKYNLPKVKYIITSPPYQLKRNYIRQKDRVEEDYQRFIQTIQEIWEI
ncbi:MAG: hypothetical protein DRP01_04980 [Archaeoglobales archaeon]|nr:MAG: hypothetical protein DRP01_04980 [Archaeoglobales archaeon]